MSSDRSRRITEGLSSLVENLMPMTDSDDEDEAAARQENALELAKSIINSQPSSSVTADVGHVGDLIKRKLLRDHPTRDEALRFSNLYSRLLTLPVPRQKWAILFLLYQLADAPELGERDSNDIGGEVVLHSEGSRPPSVMSPINDAFAHMGLQTLPGRDSRQRHRDSAAPTPTPRIARPGPGDKEMMTKAEILETNREPLEPSEMTLLRDLPYTLQGLSSKSLPFSNNSTLILPPTLPMPLVSLLHTLAEPSLLYRTLSAFVNSPDTVDTNSKNGTADANDVSGLVGQSLRAAIGEELRGYLALIAGLEGEIRRTTAMSDADDPGGLAMRKAGVTLRRCVIWTREATLGLRLMSAMVEESKKKKGGQLISAIHRFSTSYGDPFVHAFAKKLLSHVTRPFYDMLSHWIYDGELTDPFEEFFVKEQLEELHNEAANERRGHASSVWQDKYKLDNDTVPTIISTAFANKVFLIGKSLNFIRYGCEDSEWVEEYSKASSKELSYEDTNRLEQNIDEAYATTMERLMQLMNDKFKLHDHLFALKKYLLLGQGDFIALLMESLSSNLDRPANTLYRHNLTAQLEHAIRGSNAQYESQDVLRRLDARMLELSHGEIGWDVFTLEYKIDAPVDVVVTAHSSREYLKVFNFLWRIKRVEFALGSAWRRYMTGARTVLNSVEDKVGADWKIARCCVAEMIHFVAQLQYYILFQVIESSWDKLMAAVSKPNCTLDDLIYAHKTYLASITKKGLLGGASRARSHHHRDQPEETFLTQLHEILKTMLLYKDAMDGLNSYSVAEFAKRQDSSAKIETRTAAGKWGIVENDFADDFAAASSPLARMSKKNGAGGDAFGESNDDDELPALRARLKMLASEFQARTSVLLGDLASQPDMDMRFLGVMFSFNDFYVVSKKKGRTVVERRTAQQPDDKKKDENAPLSAS